MDCHSSDEVFRTIDLAKVTYPPTVWSLAIYLERTFRGDSDTTDDDARRVRVRFFVFPVIARRSIEYRNGLALVYDEEQLTLFVNFGKCSFA
jgi:hypothetical protein